MYIDAKALILYLYGGFALWHGQLKQKLEK